MREQKQFKNTSKIAYRSDSTRKKTQRLSQEAEFEILKRQRQNKVKQRKMAVVKRRIEFVLITIIVFLLAIAVGIAGYRKKKRNDRYLEKIAVLEKQIEAERNEAPRDYDCEKQGENYWMRYQDGFAAAAYTRLEKNI